ncbi:hypothetical protein Q5Y00_016890 [Aurantiacibacter sp. 219JJ12-13]|uniref:hypothetical protein n=1 Tax=Aurantiacibacter poecillastricola TaxID=3064385 RepID=UPI00273F92CA|nr:hypothetical protein [Aurantiacibacter sp. 219JJ12-13]MDP5263285.1 hypothetical protein [Aurantiacibacter sp. 219JJ12-13]
MIEVRKFETLGAAKHGWLDARHHFSFAGYHDSSRVNWGNLRVWNDDTRRFFKSYIDAFAEWIDRVAAKQ